MLTPKIISKEYYTIYFPGLDIDPMIKDDLLSVKKTLKHMYTFNALGRQGVEACVIKKFIEHSVVIDKDSLMSNLNLGGE